jgi:hypothetical protein
MIRFVLLTFQFNNFIFVVFCGSAAQVSCSQKECAYMLTSLGACAQQQIVIVHVQRGGCARARARRSVFMVLPNARTTDTRHHCTLCSTVRR